MKIIVIYKSKTGFTKRYAQWIADALMCETANYADIHNLDLSACDLVIYGGRVHAGIIDSLCKIKQLLENKPCRLVGFANKTIMKLFAKMLAGKKEQSEAEKLRQRQSSNPMKSLINSTSCLLLRM